MSGHSKWSQIKRKKAITDSKKAKIFSKLGRFISVAIKEKGSDPQNNPTLRAAIEKAKAINMPNENIERAIKKGSGEGKSFDEIILEGYGPGGIALLISAITDNKNRTNQEVRKILSDHGGKLASKGSVKWLFDFVGRMEFSAEAYVWRKEAIENLAIENDAIDFKTDGDLLVVLTAPDKLHQTKNVFEKTGFSTKDCYLDFMPKNEIEIASAGDKEQIEKLFDALDEQDDVQEIYANAKMSG